MVVTAPGQTVPGMVRSSTEGAGRRGSHRQRLGHEGEELAAGWYLERGYEIVGRNWRCRYGEIDIVARRGRLTVFCEVKARTTERFGPPADAVGPAKQARARRLAAAWFAAQAGPGLGQGSRVAAPLTTGGPVRFDVACVLAQKLDVIEGAF